VAAGGGTRRDLGKGRLARNGARVGYVPQQQSVLRPRQARWAGRRLVRLGVEGHRWGADADCRVRIVHVASEWVIRRVWARRRTRELHDRTAVGGEEGEAVEDRAGEAAFSTRHSAAADRAV